MNNVTKKYIIRLIFTCLTLTWMTTVFIFSNEPSDTSSKTSLNITKKVVEIFNKNASIEEKEQKAESLDPYIRKLAHFTLYAIGGCLILGFINTYNLTDKKKILYSICIGAIYACTDEIHQLFIEGRSGQISDVLIDSIGIATGVCIFLCVIKGIKKAKR